MKILLNKLREYNSRTLKQKKAKEESLTRQEVINAFKTDIFPYADGFQIEEESKEEESEEELDKQNNLKNLLNILRMNQRR